LIVISETISYGNLEWCTLKENLEHASKNHLVPCPNKNKFGIDHCSSIKVTQYDKNGKFIKNWDCMSDVFRALGITVASISACCRHKKYCHTAGGFKWEYTE